ncbi:MAG TPA: TonB-dependent receptor [Steroidobacteraceae bacterium]|jgi:outer membrane receptor protein involved in Fe transport|nr:TonB-dependent receptor [Steroidobacteraceae bacterium]
MFSYHRFPACRALATTSIVHLICAFAPAFSAPESDSTVNSGSSAAAAPAVDEVVVIAQRLNEARNGIQTQTGASTYTINEAAIGAQPGGDNQLLNQVIMQAPEVAQDSFGQFHVRGEHNGLQYRLNGIILPEGISVFGQSLDPRLISSMTLITGALPAEYGLRTAGIIDLKTKSGVIDPGGSVSIYGGSHGTVEPSFNYGGSEGRFNYFVSGDFLRNDLGIESPDGRSSPDHDHTTQYHEFAYLEYILDESDRLSAVLSSSAGKFQIPNRGNQSAGIANADGTPLTVDGQTTFPSDALDENQRELNHFAILSWQHSQGAFDVQTSLTARYSSLDFTPDPLGDILFDGIAQNAFKQNIAYAVQSDAAYRLNDGHTLRAGVFLQSDHSKSLTSSAVIALDEAGNQISDIPVTIIDNGAKTEWIESAYLQDEWKLIPTVTVNYGLRFDKFTAFASGHQVSPRVNVVWQALPDTTVHAGYSRYLSPPPFELVGTETVAKFANTTAAASILQADTPLPEQANYYDIGAQQKITDQITLGLDSYYKQSHNLIDEGQFGAPIILTPFNYTYGKQYGVELTSSYTAEDFTAYLNLAWQSARGKNIDSAQFNFGEDDLAYIADHYIHLDHEQRVTASGGASYRWGHTRFSADVLVGSGLRADLQLPDGSSIPNGAHLPYYTQVNFGASRVFHLGDSGTLTARFDVINVLDKRYEIRDGTGVGVGAPQFGPRRGLFFGLSKSI